jgi:hypothetical protein
MTNVEINGIPGVTSIPLDATQGFVFGLVQRVFGYQHFTHHHSFSFNGEQLYTGTPIVYRRHYPEHIVKITYCPCPDMPTNVRTVVRWTDVSSEEYNVYVPNKVLVSELQQIIAGAFGYEGTMDGFTMYCDEKRMISNACDIMYDGMVICCHSVVDRARVLDHPMDREPKKGGLAEWAVTVYKGSDTPNIEVKGAKHRTRRTDRMIEMEKNNQCPECSTGLVTMPEMAMEVCPGYKEVRTDSKGGVYVATVECNYVRTFESTSKYSYPFGQKLSPQEGSYKRSNHFNEWLSQFQAKERSPPPNHVFDEVKKKYLQNRFDLEVDVNPARTKKFLKELNKEYPKKQFRKYYEHTQQISYIISGAPPARMSMEQEETVRIMFRAMQIPFEKCPKSIKLKRKNFLSYPYVLYKMCELLEYDEFLASFPLLKSKDRLKKHDAIWKWICQWKKWEYVETSPDTSNMIHAQKVTWWKRHTRDRQQESSSKTSSKPTIQGDG